MRLRYLHGPTMTVHFGDEAKGAIEYTVNFTPEGDVPDAFVERLLKKYPKDYKVLDAPKVAPQEDAPAEKPAEPEVAKCDECDKTFGSAQGLLIHKKRMHKEKQ